MDGVYKSTRRVRRWLRARLFGFAVERQGSVSPMLTLMIIPLVGMLGMATEASSWFFAQRSMQAAADAAAMAAATNGCDAGQAACVAALTPYYDVEALSVASRFGFVNGVADTEVTASNTAPCPAPLTGSNCYRVTIRRLMPVNLTRIVGFQGDATTDAGAMQTVVATAVASPKVRDTYCLLALASGGAGVEGIRCNGCSKADMSGCKVATNGYARCNGGDLNADASDAVGNQSNCAAGGAGTTGVDPIADPYSGLAANIPPDTCAGTYSDKTVTATTLTLGATPLTYCGGVTFSNGVTITTPASGGVIVVRKGSLVVPGGQTLRTANGSHLTIIFAGPHANKVMHILDGGGTVDFAAPTSGDWSGVAVYQDPALTSGVDWSAAGNSPTWNITGLIYLPRAAVTVSGIVNKASNGHNCFALVVDTFHSNGTTTFLEKQTECPQAGLKPPTGPNTTRTALVQ